MAVSVSWIARQCRPDEARITSTLQGSVSRASVKYLSDASWSLNRQTKTGHVGIRIHSIALDDVRTASTQPYYTTTTAEFLSNVLPSRAANATRHRYTAIDTTIRPIYHHTIPLSRPLQMLLSTTPPKRSLLQPLSTAASSQLPLSINTQF